jgi:predicted Rossmann fold nucleotide-binding protein DprA/Smf involved in DNA uptake
MGRADPTYPRRFKQRLRQSAPPLLYVCGNLDLLSWPALAVVGSRSTPEALLRQAEAVGALAAEAGVVIASGAAKGVDEIAMAGTLAAGGCAIGVVADSLEKISARPIWRQALLEGRLLLLSGEAPSARFQVWRAMGRNKLIYALANSALVVSSAKGEGGTWAGATEQLQRLRFCPIHVLSDPRGGPGLAALAEIGAAQWPEPCSPEALRALLHGTGALVPPARNLAEEVQQGNFLAPRPTESTPPTSTFITTPVEVTAQEPACEERQSHSPSDITSDGEQETQAPAAVLAAFVDELVLNCLREPMALDELAELLDVSKTEVKRWCQRLAEQGLVRKLSKPVRYARQDAAR